MNRVRGVVATVGLIANPHSSKDIRRLVGLARVIDVEEKANMIARFLMGMTAGPPVQVVALDDAGGLVRRALKLLRGAGPPVEFLAIEASAGESDTRRAMLALRSREVGVVVTVGGDGTVRAAVEAWPDATLAPIPAGTNNAITIPHEPTVVGVAAALAAHDLLEPGAYEPMTIMRVDTGDESTVAVVDVVGVRTHWTGARALWDPADFVEAVVANARPTAVGIASVAARAGPPMAGRARHLVFGGDLVVRSLIGPGSVEDVPVAGYTDLPVGSVVELDSACRVVALDGERRLVTSGSARVEVMAGPRQVVVTTALAGLPFPAIPVR